MPTQPRPWRRQGRAGGAWYAQVAGRKERLAGAEATFEEALAVLHGLLGDRARGVAPAAPGYTAGDVLNLFVAHVRDAVARGDLAAVTEEGYLRFLVPARGRFGHVPAADLRPLHVTAWADADPPGWGPTTRFNAITAVKAAFAWARRAGHIDANPVEGTPRPTPRRRAAIPTAGQVCEVLDAIRDQRFRDLVVALVETGCRPGELCGLAAAGMDLARGVWHVRNKTARKTGEGTRKVYLTPVMVALSRRLAAERPEGPVFRNAAGDPWTRNAIIWRFRRIRRRLGLGPEVTAYAFRHGYVTAAVENGVDVATLAELVGHRDATMILRTYSHLGDRGDHMRDAARKARGG